MSKTNKPKSPWGRKSPDAMTPPPLMADESLLPLDPSMMGIGKGMEFAMSGMGNTPPSQPQAQPPLMQSEPVIPPVNKMAQTPVAPQQPERKPIDPNVFKEGVSFGVKGRGMPVNNPQTADLEEELLANDGDLYRQLVARQQQAVNNKLASKSTGSYMDLTSIMQAVDNMTGSNMAKTYRAPGSVEQDMATTNSLAKQLADFEGDKEKNRIALLNALNKEGKTDPYQLAMFKHQLSMQGKAAGQGTGGMKPMEILRARKQFDDHASVKNMNGLVDFNAKLDSYNKVLGKLGSDNNFEMTGELAAELEKAYNDVAIAYKEHEAKLGALAGPDMGILQGVFKPVHGVGGAKNAAFGGGASAVKKAIQDFQSKTKSKAQLERNKIAKTFTGFEDVVGDQLSNYDQMINSMAVPESPATTPQASKKGGKTAAQIKAEEKLKALGLL